MTCFGINNEGQLVLDYYHEDTDQLEGANVYNGQKSVLWCNFRDAFPDKIKETYQDLRSNGVLNYDEMREQFITKGSDKWSESIYNEDADFKYISMLYSDNDASNLGQVRGTGEEHLEYFLENRFNYCDGKWYAPDYADDYVALRIYTPVDENGAPRTDLAVAANADITVTPYSYMYAGLRYKANGTLQQKRVSANEVTTFEAPNETFNDTETAIYGASQLSSLGDLSPLYCGSINVSKATKLTELIIGNDTEGYSNPNLNDLSVGTNNLLKVINVRNCPKLTDPLALAGCPNIEEIYAAGSAITGIDLANSGYLKVIELPATIANLTLKNQLYVESLTLEGYSAIKTINIENCPTVASLDILGAATNVERVRLTNVNWTYDTAAEVLALADRNLAGIDETGANIDKMWIDGKCHIKSLTGADYLKVKEAFPYMTITYDNLTAKLTYMSEDGSVKLHEETIVNGGDGNAIVADSDNLIVLSECTSTGGFPDGTNIANLPLLLTPFIPVTPNTTYKTNITRYYDDTNWNSMQKLAYYDAEQNCIKVSQWQPNLPMGTINDVAIGDNVYYIRFAFREEYTNPYFGKSGVISNGDIVTPTKESTAQYHFTYSGWSLTPGGVADPKALTKVEADRTVYVAFAKELRSYTVKFYNGTTLLQTSTVQYGGDAVYSGSTPVNNSTGNPDDFEFYGWKPSPTNIQGDTDCYAQFYDLREITDDWATIAANVANGTATEKYSIGAFKTLDIGVKDLPYNFDSGSAVVLNGEIHILGSASSEYRKYHYKWTGTEWVKVSTLPYEFYYASAVVLNNEIHILGSSMYSVSYKAHYKWDGSAWTKVSTLPHKFAKGVAVVYNNEIHILGSEDSSARTSHYKWTGTEWVSVSTLPYEFYNGSTVVYNNEIHITGSGNSKYETNHYKWNGSTWTSVSTLPQKLNNGHALVVGTNIYMIQWDEFYKYDGTNWSMATNVPVNVYEGRSVVLNGDIYVMGSSISENEKAFYSYSPETGTWGKLGLTESIPMEVIAHNHDELAVDQTWNALSPLPYNFYTGSAVILNNEIHILGGQGDHDAHYKWNGTNWVSVSTLPYRFYRSVAVVYNDEIHILGTDYSRSTYGVCHYKWTGTEWVSVSTLPYIFYYGGVVVYNDEIHIMGSGESAHNTKHYKWTGTEWVSVSTLPYACYESSVIIYNNEIHLLGGTYSSDERTNHYKWNGTEWTSVSTLPFEFWEGAAVIFNNDIHIIGGYGDETAHYKWNGTEWTSVSTLPFEFYYGCGVVYNNKITLLGSQVTAYRTTFTQLVGASFEQIGALPVGQTNYGRAVYNNAIHYMFKNAHYKYQNGEWSEASTLPTTFSHHPTIVAYNDKLHVFCNTTHYTWDETDGWLEIGTFPHAIGANNGSSIVYNNCIHLISTLNGRFHMVYDGTTWTTLNETIPGTILSESLAVYDGKLHAMVHNTYNHYTWDETNGWSSAMTIPFKYSSGGIAVYEDCLYALANDEYGGFYKFDGDKWSLICCTGYGSIGGSLVVYNDRIHRLGAQSSKDGTVLNAYNFHFVLKNPRATLTFLAKNLLKDDRQFHSNVSHHYWSISDLRAWCNGDFYTALPEDLQDSISEVIKISDTGYTEQSLENVNDKIWICSAEETGYSSANIVVGQGDAYSTFTDNSSRKRYTIDGTVHSYWLRTANTHYNKYAFIINGGTGKCDRAQVDTTLYVLPGFCI